MHPKLNMTALALVLALPSMALAQDSPATAPGAPTTTPAEPTMGGAGDTAAAKSWYAGKRGEEIVGQDQYGADGAEIGEVKNVIIGVDGRQAAAVVSVGGSLGVGERDVAIPLDQLSMDAENRLSISMTKESLSGMEPYEDGGGSNIFARSRTFE